MAKRKLAKVESGDVVEPRRSARRKTETREPTKDLPVSKTATPAKSLKKTSGKKSTSDQKEEVEEKVDDKSNGAKEEAPIRTSTSEAVSTSTPGRQYWLLKAEPESRLESGHDVKFSIDDLASKSEPEPWDGIRNPSARNNLRAMKKGDLAFFYHSNCKVPAIVGIMEIVREHSPDLTARDPKAAYYDPKDKGQVPKWSVVHVEFRRKFKEPVTLKELREFGAKGGGLENMQMLKQSRLSVSNVSREEWEFLMNVIEEREK